MLETSLLRARNAENTFLQMDIMRPEVVRQLNF